MKRGRAALLAAILALAGHGAGGATAKSDFRGLETGMTVAQAEAAASKADMACETDFTERTTCRGHGASVVLVTTGRNGNPIWELQVTLDGHFDDAAMHKKLDAFYGLKATPTPHVFDTAAGQQLMLLSVGGSATIFYLINPVVLHGDPEALPPPKL